MIVTTAAVQCNKDQVQDISPLAFLAQTTSVTNGDSLSRLPVVGGSAILATNGWTFGNTHILQPGQSFAPWSGTVLPILRSGTVSSFKLNIGANANNGTTIITLMKNGVATNISVSIPANTTGTYSNDNTVEYLATDTLSFRIDVTAVGTGGMYFAYVYLYD